MRTEEKFSAAFDEAAARTPEMKGAEDVFFFMASRFYGMPVEDVEAYYHAECRIVNVVFSVGGLLLSVSKPLETAGDPNVAFCSGLGGTPVAVEICDIDTVADYARNFAFPPAGDACVEEAALGEILRSGNGYCGDVCPGFDIRWLWERLSRLGIVRIGADGRGLPRYSVTDEGQIRMMASAKKMEDAMDGIARFMENDI